MTEEEKKKKRVVILAESKPDESGKRDQAFVSEAGNMKSFYAKKFPDAEVEVVPVYGDEEWISAKERMKGADEVHLYGHSGSRLMGKPHAEIAKDIKESGAKKCYMGSCSFEEYAENYKELPDFFFKKKRNWFGVDPNAENVIHAMFSKDYTGNDKDKWGASIVTPKEGDQYSRFFNRPVEKPIEMDRKDLIKFTPLGALVK